MIGKHLIDFKLLINTHVFQKEEEEDSYLLHIVKDVVVVKLFTSIHPSRHPSMDGIIQVIKPWQK
jgi:hypothetical protein